MAKSKLKEELLRELDRMPTEAPYSARFLVRSPQGTLIEELGPLAGTLDDESARDMRWAIDEGCEQVDLNGWHSMPMHEVDRMILADPK